MARIYQTDKMEEAHCRIALVSHDEADLLVHRVASRLLALGDVRWYISRDKKDATCWVYFCSSGIADVKICFVNTLAEAGWQKPNRYKGRFG